MANTILGYEIASAEQQKKTALAILGFIGVIAIGGGIAAFTIAGFEQSGRQQALATVLSYDTKCRYVVRNLSKRVSYYDHTGYIGCAKAHRVARQNDNSLGSVQQRTVARIRFTTLDSQQVRTSVALYGDKPVSVGKQVEILYRTDNPNDATQFKNIALFGKKSIASQSTDNAAAGKSEVKPSDKSGFQLRATKSGADSTVEDSNNTAKAAAAKATPSRPDRDLPKVCRIPLRCGSA